MRCKVGDICVKVKARPVARMPVGAIVQIIGQKFNDVVSGVDGSKKPYSHGWLVEWNGSDRDHETGLYWVAFDEELRPLRDDPGTDETLTWAPKGVTA